MIDQQSLEYGHCKPRVNRDGVNASSSPTWDASISQTPHYIDTKLLMIILKICHDYR